MGRDASRGGHASHQGQSAAVNTRGVLKNFIFLPFPKFGDIVLKTREEKNTSRLRGPVCANKFRQPCQAACGPWRLPAPAAASSLAGTRLLLAAEAPSGGPSAGTRHSGAGSWLCACVWCLGRWLTGASSRSPGRSAGHLGMVDVACPSSAHLACKCATRQPLARAGGRRTCSSRSSSAALVGLLASSASAASYSTLRTCRMAGFCRSWWDGPLGRQEAAPVACQAMAANRKVRSGKARLTAASSPPLAPSAPRTAAWQSAVKLPFALTVICR